MTDRYDIVIIGPVRAVTSRRSARGGALAVEVEQPRQRVVFDDRRASNRAATTAAFEPVYPKPGNGAVRRAPGGLAFAPNGREPRLLLPRQPRRAVVKLERDWARLSYNQLI
jgi:hypothetical protein